VKHRFVRLWRLLPVLALILAGPALADEPAVVTRGQAGYWRLVKSSDGVWWFESPSGERKFLNTVEMARPWVLTPDPSGRHEISPDWKGGVPPTLFGKKHDLAVPDYFRKAHEKEFAEYADKTAVRIKAAGFDGLGSWSDPSLEKADIPFTKALSLMVPDNFRNKHADDPAFVDHLRRRIAESIAGLKDSKNLVGYYIDNEVSWYDWTEDEVRTYFKTVQKVLREQDPNHLILGVRFQGFACDHVLRASKGIFDAQSINLYSADAKFNKSQMDLLTHEGGDNPVIVSEFGFHYINPDEGYLNKVGFTAQVADSAARAEAYKTFVTWAAKQPNLVSTSYFMWSRQPSTGRHDGEDSNFSPLRPDGSVEPEMQKAIADVQATISRAHKESPKADRRGIWQEPTLKERPQTPLATIKNFKLDCQISRDEWPESSRIKLRRKNALGSQRAPEPNFYVAVNEKGVYFAAEVFDAVPVPTGITSDWGDHNIDLLLATRMTRPEETYLDETCRKYVFLAETRPEGFGAVGEVIQLPKNANGQIKKQLVYPKPQIQSKACQLPAGKPDRYLVEGFIPKEQLSGFDPANPLSLNLQIHTLSGDNFYWSASRSTGFGLPGKWGVLDPRAPGGAAEAGGAPATTTAQ
jgi:hypothetical protein